MNKEKEIFRSALYGLAIGDALGVPAEFHYQDDVRKMNIKHMMPLGSIPAGSYSDDTAMALACLDGMNKNGYNFDKIMNNFVDWVETGKYSSLSYPFGMGTCCLKALSNYKKNHDVKTCGCKDYRENGNGSLMRILPACIYINSLDLDLDESIKLLNKFTSLTHAHSISLMGDTIYFLFITYLINVNNDKKEAFDYIINFDYSKYYDEETIKEYNCVLTNDLIKKDDIESKKNGYVVYTLEGVLFSIMKNNDFKSSVICAIELGFDSDTLGAIAGSIAAIMYGIDNIPTDWIDDLRNKELIEKLLNNYYEC